MAFVLLLASLVPLLFTVMPSVSAQTQFIEATPGYINFGMTTFINVTAPAAASYTVVVTQPNGTQASVDFTFSSVGQTQSAIYGNSSSGFHTVVNQVGTYNVFLERGGQVVSATSFYATNKLTVAMDMTTGGTCAYIAGATRGTEMYPRFSIAFASTNTPATNTDPGISVTFTLPNGSSASAPWDPYAHFFVGKVFPNWNFTSVGPWSPSASVSDAAGNHGSFQYTGAPYTISPVQLSTQIQFLDAVTGQPVTSLYNGLGITIQATITYPTNAEPVPGFVGPLDSVRGGSVTAQVGWGYYNETSGTFGGQSPGSLLGTVLMTYTGSNGTWKGQFVSSSLPKLQAGLSYEVVVSSKDSASPVNTGFAIASIAPATGSTTNTSTSVSVTTQTAVQTVQSIPTVVYAALAILLIVGIIIGYIVRVPR